MGSFKGTGTVYDNRKSRLGAVWVHTCVTSAENKHLKGGIIRRCIAQIRPGFVERLNMRLNLVAVLTCLMLCLFLIGCASRSSNEVMRERLAAEYVQSSEKAPVLVETATVTYGNLDGKTIRGYLARPASSKGPLPAVLLVHDWWGVNETVKATARLLAKEGYLALVVDLYQGEVATEPQTARTLLVSVIENTAPVEANLQQAYVYLSTVERVRKIGVIGWSIGGKWALEAPLILPGPVHGAVVYYGELITDPYRLATLRTPVMAFFGKEDRGIPPESVGFFETTMNELGKDVEIYLYDDVGHGFANPNGTQYKRRPEPALDAWRHTLSFFKRHLKR